MNVCLNYLIPYILKKMHLYKKEIVKEIGHHKDVQGSQRPLCITKTHHPHGLIKPRESNGVAVWAHSPPNPCRE